MSRRHLINSSDVFVIKGFTVSGRCLYQYKKDDFSISMYKFTIYKQVKLLIDSISFCPCYMCIHAAAWKLRWNQKCKSKVNLIVLIYTTTTETYFKDIREAKILSICTKQRTCRDMNASRLVTRHFGEGLFKLVSNSLQLLLFLIQLIF